MEVKKLEMQNKTYKIYSIYFVRFKALYIKNGKAHIFHFINF